MLRLADDYCKLGGVRSETARTEIRPSITVPERSLERHTCTFLTPCFLSFNLKVNFGATSRKFLASVAWIP
jgi:hypothetical protein